MISSLLGSPRGKSLANSLRGCGFAGAAVAAMLEETGIEGTRRGETLFMEEFAALSRAYYALEQEAGVDVKQ